MTKRRWLRLLGAGCLAEALVLGSGAGSAGAAGPGGQTGWWNQLNPSATSGTPLAAVVAPPDVPPGGLYLANAPSGPLGVSALRVDAGGTGTATLTLEAASGAGFAPPVAVSACPATSKWGPAVNGAWEDRPSYGTTCVQGLAATDGASMRWVVTSGFERDGHTFDVVLVPQGPSPFRTVVAPPDDTTLTNLQVTSSAAPAPPASAPTAAPAGPVDQVGASTPSTGAVFAPPVGPAYALPAPSTPALSAPAPVALRVQPATGQTPVGRDGGGTSTDDRRGERVMAVALLAALGLALFWYGGRPVRGPRLLGGGASGVSGASGSLAAGAGGPTVSLGGVGRFARPRTAPPQRL